MVILMIAVPLTTVALNVSLPTLIVTLPVALSPITTTIVPLPLSTITGSTTALVPLATNSPTV